MLERFKDRGQTLESFGNEFLVHCPQCQTCCKVMVKSGEMNALLSPRVIACGQCGFSKQWAGKSVRIYDDGRDWYFGLPLWLRVSCAGETLWVLNAAHLQFLESYFEASIREQTPNLNRSLISRLPHWMKDAKNEPEIKKALQKLRDKLTK